MSAVQTGEIKIVHGEGCNGFEEEGPYDLIHVGVGFPVIPEKLYE